MKKFWLEALLISLFLSLLGGVLIYIISNSFQLTLGSIIGWFVGSLVVWLIGWIKLKKEVKKMVKDIKNN